MDGYRFWQSVLEAFLCGMEKQFTKMRELTGGDSVFCLNLCEILTPAFLGQEKPEELISKVVKENQITEPLERIYAGSSFCSQYFLHLSCWDALFDWCRENGWNLTVTLPVFSQKDLKKGKERIGEILEKGKDVADEVTVNDFGMLKYMSDQFDIRINLGRLFFKDARDVRVRPYQEGEMTPNLLSCRDDFMEGNDKIRGVEIDPTNRYIDLRNCDLDGIDLGIHSPFCYMTTGNICKFASIHAAVEEKFRPNAPCHMECAGIYEHYREKFDGRNADLIRYGRTVYFYNNGSRIAGKKIDRKIYFPVLEMEEQKKGGKKG
ncbi:MAG: hypothetical protein MR867_07715 [Eubacterium sp.]|nr:hypothetical protein [Eubacterium sp.]MDD7210513.1 hypothetical protein [Lachnospiraceae bacterium]MDY5497371.1 hypothetical protein [Anaerobutyricum sp.]